MLTARARLAGKPVEGLETPEEQLTIFHDLTETDQRAMLAEAVTDADDEGPQLKATVADWLGGRTDALAARVNRDFASTPGVRAALLTARNRRWAAWIADRLQRPGSVVVAVGAGHLAGPDSVQAQLARLGITITRVADPAAVSSRSRRPPSR